MSFLIAAAIAGLAACGQTGSLYLPDESVETPVEIRSPGAPAPSPQVPQTEPDKDEEEKSTQPPGL